MPDNHHPSVDLDFIIDNLMSCHKVIPESKANVGPNMTTFVLQGNKPMHKRHIIITHKNNEVNFNQASSLALNYQFLGSLLKWLEINKNWKEGGYIEPKEVPEDIETEEE